MEREDEESAGRPMSLNWREIDCILEELELSGSHIQKIVQPDFTSLVLSLYRPGDPFELFISLAPGATRLHRMSTKPLRAERLQRFAQFLRARCGGGRIEEAAQLGHERIVRLAVVTSGVTTLLWIRLWSGAANIVATDEEGTILDAFFRRPKRGETSGGHFDPAAGLKAGRDPKDDEKYQIRPLPGDGSFSARVEQHYLEHTIPDVRREQALKAIIQRETRVASSLETLERKMRDYENPDRFKQIGDVIMSNLHALHPGDSWLRADNFYENNEPTEIELDPMKSGAENAERYYQRFKKAKAGLVKLREEVDALREAQNELERRREQLESGQADTATAPAFLPHPRPAPSKSKEPRPGLQFSSGSYTILVGRSAKENDALLRKFVRGNDFWLHTRDYPGAYVFIKSIPAKSIPLEVLLDAGNLAVHYSKAKSGGQAELYYTMVKHLRRPREGKLGLVLPTHEKNLSVRLDSARIDHLFARREGGEGDTT